MDSELIEQADEILLVSDDSCGNWNEQHFDLTRPLSTKTQHSTRQWKLQQLVQTRLLEKSESKRG
jgi:hypothetical protein